MYRTVQFFLSLLLFLFLSNAGFATHLRAGEILVESINGPGSNFKIHIIVYSDPLSNILPGGGTLDLGDGTIISPLVGNCEATQEALDNQIIKNTYTVIHRYPGDSKEYLISYQEVNRNGGIINMSNSVNTPFYIETSISTNPPCGINNTPILSIPPVDYGITGRIFVHDPGAYDLEGDSLSYRMVIPKQAEDVDVSGYTFPDGISIDPLTGLITWPVPDLTGQYNIAFVVDEWRFVNGKAEFLSSTERDMQVIVVDNQDKPPEITIPPDTCLQAGDFISEQVTATDPDGYLVKIEPFGKAFSVTQSPAQLLPDSIFYSPVPVTRQFSWQTDLAHISSQPYKIHFKASNDPDGSFPRVDFKTWTIQVSAPAPKNVKAAYQENGIISLSWDQYEFGAEKIQVNRRIAAYSIPVSPCTTGIPFYAQYDHIADTNGDAMIFSDMPEEGRFNRGARYCYRLLAKIPGCTETESAVSNEACVDIPVDAPAITNVSVLKTDTTDGQIFIRWTSSFDIDKSMHDTSKFAYQVQRAEGYTGKENAMIISPDKLTDTTFIDTGINTSEKVFNYKIYLVEDNVVLDSSATASSVRLSSEPVLDKIGLRWKTEVPWSNNTQKYPYHLIFRDRSLNSNPEAFSLIDSVNVNYDFFHYVDSAQFDHKPLDGRYCYYVVTYGSYGNPRILEPLLNRSQIFCSYKEDTIAPCAPEVTLLNKNNCNEISFPQPCESMNFYNNLSLKPTCGDQDLKEYDIYFSDNRSGPFSYIGFTENTNYIHDSLPSFKGCYKAVAVDHSGNQSPESEMVCNDNCPVFILPNVFTPNNDGHNDVFSDFQNAEKNSFEANCPQFIREVHFSVVNRWGKLIYKYNAKHLDVLRLNWNGNDNEGHKVRPGVYYYTAKVIFDVLDPDEQVHTYNGWIQVLY